MNKLYLHIKRWNQWRKHVKGETFHKFMVLIGLHKSPTFEIFLIPEDMWDRNTRVVHRNKVLTTISMLLSLAAFILSIVGLIYTLRTPEVEPAVEPAVIDIIDEPISEEVNEPVLVETEPVIVEATYEPKVSYFNVPLSEDLQDHIFSVCEERNVDPAIIMAMIDRESDYNSNCVSDGGDSVGLMQIQAKWHWGLMESLGCTDLTDPYQNVTVGINLFANLYKQGGSLEWALMAYNGGPSYANRKTSQGVVSDYASSVLFNSKTLEEGRI